MIILFSSSRASLSSVAVWSSSSEHTGAHQRHQDIRQLYARILNKQTRPPRHAFYFVCLCSIYFADDAARLVSFARHRFLVRAARAYPFLLDQLLDRQRTATAACEYSSALLGLIIGKLTVACTRAAPLPLASRCPLLWVILCHSACVPTVVRQHWYCPIWCAHFVSLWSLPKAIRYLHWK